MQKIIFVPSRFKKIRFKSIHKDLQELYGAASLLDSKTSELLHPAIGAGCSMLSTSH